MNTLLPKRWYPYRTIWRSKKNAQNLSFLLDIFWTIPGQYSIRGMVQKMSPRANFVKPRALPDVFYKHTLSGLAV